MECPRCSTVKAYPVQPAEVDGDPGIEIACANCGTFRRRRADLDVGDAPADG